MKIACWNVNSIQVRLPHVLRWIEEHAPDVLLLQELKGETASFPALELSSAGYSLAVFGQKAYNGVAILSKIPLRQTRQSLSDFPDTAARYIEADLDNGVTVASVYVPNGNEVGSDKFDYKMRFFDALHTHVQQKKAHETPFIIGGDFNVAFDERDTYAPDKAVKNVLFTPMEQKKMRTLVYGGYADVWRESHPHDSHVYSWWDYREGRQERNEGYRIDYVLANPWAMDALLESGIDPAPRGWDKPSDHVPVWATFRF